MAGRGVTRDHHHAGAHGPDERAEALRTHHRQTLWVYWLLILAGVWLLWAPFTLGYLEPGSWVRPSGGRGAWLSDALHTGLRARLTVWSDLISGVLLVVFGWRALRPGRPVALWACCFVGIWLTLAPVLLWAPTPAAYLNDTLVGILVIALAILIPGMPNMIAYMQMGPPKPPGWSYNPSSWPQRWILIALGFVGFVVSRQLAAYQLGYTDGVWEPFFGGGSERVLDSEMSHMWPVSDAALGTVAYTFEFLMGWMGSPSRWRTMPWMVALFGILVIPLGLVHIALVISQPIVVGAWCTLCLLAAAIMLPMIPLEVDEVIAMGQHLRQAGRRGEPLWRVFWKGGSAEGSEQDERSPELALLPREPRAVLGSSVWGMTVPWTLATCAAVGVWMLFAPAVLGLAGSAADVHHLGGSLLVVVSVVSMGEPLRALRFLNVPVALGTALLVWMAGGGGGAAYGAAAAALAVTALSLPRGPVRERYGSWDRLVF